MKIFSTKVHGFLDYLVAGALLVMPSLLNLQPSSIPGMVFYILGGTLLFYSLLTNYELGLIKVLPMNLHLALDVLSGMFLAASPWIFGFEEQVFIPYLILGVAEMVAGLSTTSKVGVPEVQQLVAVETIQPVNLQENGIAKPKTAKATKTAPARKPAENKKPAAPKSEETKANADKKPVAKKQVSQKPATKKPVKKQQAVKK